MSKELRELLAKLESKKTEVRTFMGEDKMEAAESAMEEVRSLEKKIELQRSLDEAENNGTDTGKPVGGDDQEDEQRDLINTNEYRNAWFKALTGRADELEDEERTMLKKVIQENRSLSAGSDKDGGYTVPQDISKQILKAIQEMNTVRNLVRVVPKTAPSGSYTVRKGVAGKLYNTAEKEAIKELKNMEFEQILYNVKKFAGFMPISSELLNDSFVNFTREIIDWLSESAVVTENDELFYGTGGDNGVEGIISSGKFKTIVAPETIDIKFLRKVKNQIKQGYRRNAVWVMNTEAFERLANIEDKNGRGILAADPRDEDKFNLFGRPVQIYDEVLTDEVTKKTHIMFGDFKRGYFMFDRMKFEIKSTDVGADAFLTDQMYFRGIERFDGKVVDPEAAIIVTDLVVGEDIPEV